MIDAQYTHDWSDFAFGSKRSINDLNATFIAAPREISKKRFTQLVKMFLPQSNIVIGVAKEPYIDGFMEQLQFKTLRIKEIENVIAKVNVASPKHKIHVLNYHQKEAPYLYDKLKFREIILIRGSWLHAFHTRSEFYTLTLKQTPLKYASPFADEDEAKDYASKVKRLESDSHPRDGAQMLELANEAAKQSFDYMFQTGAALGQPKDNKYTPLLTAYNKVIPYETYAMHHGAAREVHFSPPNDLNHYDTIHAEVDLLIEAQKNNVSLKGTTLFINLMPCPTCTRMIAATDIAEVVYQIDHSNGYALTMLEAAGKVVKRQVV